MCKVIAVANMKGGVGKTTTAVNLGIGLAMQGKRVLLLDCDSQGSLTSSLGFRKPSVLETSIATIMAAVIAEEKVPDGILHHPEGQYVSELQIHVQPECQTEIREDAGQKVRKSDVKRFYNSLVDDKNLSAATIDGIHTVLHQVFDLAVDDHYIRSNPCDNVLRELKQSHVFKTEKRRGLTRQEQDQFLDYLKKSEKYRHWYPIFAVMIGSGLRVGEVTGLRWCDIDLEDGLIHVNHTLVYYKHEVNGCYFNIHTPKTEAGRRSVPMLDFVKEAFLEEKRRQEEEGTKCLVRVDGYTDFIFINRFGMLQYQSTLNKAIRRITRDCNDAVLRKNPNAKVLLPHFSCHSLRHTFTTRMCEAGVNVKVIQDTLGHADISTTLNIYADVTKDLKKAEFEGLDKWFAKSMGQKNGDKNTGPETGDREEGDS